MPRRPAPRGPRRHTVATVISPGVAPFEMAVPCEGFGIDRSELVHRRTFRRIGA